jgi:hypothetical protein
MQIAPIAVAVAAAAVVVAADNDCLQHVQLLHGCHKAGNRYTQQLTALAEPCKFAGHVRACINHTNWLLHHRGFDTANSTWNML